ncbi:MAG: hypothetical protein ACPG4Y_03020, partial [Chitinophagales bacterium]
MEKVDNILKCIFIVPATLAISFFVFVLLVIVSMFLLSITNAKLYIVAVCIIPACVAFTWLSTSYQLAAFYKKEITWLSYF